MILSVLTFNIEIVISSPKPDCALTSIIKFHVATLVETKRKSITARKLLHIISFSFLDIINTAS